MVSDDIRLCIIVAFIWLATSLLTDDVATCILATVMAIVFLAMAAIMVARGIAENVGN